jgi:hypothetical protein
MVYGLLFVVVLVPEDGLIAGFRFILPVYNSFPLSKTADYAGFPAQRTLSGVSD